jgi:hypothetical protein
MVPAVAALPDEVRRVGVGQGCGSVRLRDTNNQQLATAAHHRATINDLVCGSGSGCPSVGQRDRKEARRCRKRCCCSVVLQSSTSSMQYNSSILDASSGACLSSCTASQHVSRLARPCRRYSARPRLQAIQEHAYSLRIVGLGRIGRGCPSNPQVTPKLVNLLELCW